MPNESDSLIHDAAVLDATSLDSELQSIQSEENLVDKTFHPHLISRTNINGKGQLSIDIAAAAIFGALTYISAFFITPVLPQVPGWGITYLDPISAIWMIAFFVFGFRAGLITLVVGSLLLIPFDDFVFIGPVMKFTATLPMLVGIYIFSKIKYKKNSEETLGSTVRNMKNIIPASGIAILIRIILMIALNFIVLTAMGWINYLNADSMQWLGLGEMPVSAMIIITAGLINLWQGIFDVVVGYFIAYTCKLYDIFKLW